MPEQGQTGAAGANSGVYGSGESVGNFVVPPPPLGPQPSQPVNLIASDNLYSDKILVTWNASDNATSYDIYKDGVFFVTTTSTTVDDISTIPGITYSYYVVAKNGLVASIPSNTDTGSRQLTEPTNFDAINGQSSTTISLTWNSVTYATSYKIYRGISSSTSSMSVVGTTTNTTYDDSLSLVYGTTYYYAVKAVCSTGDSNFSNVDSDLLYASIPNSPIVTASDGTYTDKIVVSWNSVPNALRYVVYRDGVEIQNTTDLTYNDTDTTVVAGTVYYYNVVATNFTGSSISDTNSTNSGWKKLSAPASLVASNGTSTSQITLGWDGVTGATSYKIYRAVLGGSFFQIDTSATPIYNDGNTDLIYGIIYDYKIIASCTLGDSDFSNSDVGFLKLLGTVPAAPTGLSATDGTSTSSVTLTWNAVTGSNPVLLGYRVFRDGVPIAVSTINSYTDTPIAGTLFTYTVKAYNGNGDSALSTSDTGWVKLSTPAGLTATDGTSTSEITLGWNSVTGATSYKIYRSTDGTVFSQIDTSTSTSYNDGNTDLLYSTLYYYKIAASCTLGDSDFSNIDSGILQTIIPVGTVPAAPTGLSATDGTSTSSVTLTWNAVTGSNPVLTGYRVFKNGVQIATPATNSYTDTPTAGTLFTYTVKAVNSIGDSTASASDTGSVKLSTPTGLTASIGVFSKITLGWNAVIGATSYKIYRSPNGVTFFQIDTSATTSYNDTDTDLIYDVLYYYKIAASCALGDSDLDVDIVPGMIQTVRSAPVAPTGFLAGDGVSSNSIPLIWNAVTGSNPVLTGYRVFKNGVRIASTTGTSTTYNDGSASVTPATLFTYSVKAYNSIGDGAASNSDTGWKNLRDPVILEVSTSFTNKIVITWGGVTGATSYSVYRGTDITTQNQLIQSGISSSTTTYEDTTSLSAGIVYYYKIAAVSALGSAYSLPVSGNIIYQLVTEGDIFENYFGNNTLKSVNLTINSLNTNNVYDNHFTFEKYNNPMGAITHLSLYALSDNRYTKQIFHSNKQDTTNGGLNYLEKIIVSDFGNYANTFSAGERLFKNFDVYRGEGDSLYKNDITCIRPTYTSLSAKVIEPVVAPS